MSIFKKIRAQMRKRSFFWKIYLAMTILIIFPLTLFTAYDMFYRKTDKELNNNFISTLEWSAQILANQVEYIPEDKLISWIGETEKSSGLEIYVERGGKVFYSKDAKWFTLYGHDDIPPPPKGPVSVKVTSSDGDVNLVAFFHIPARFHPETDAAAARIIIMMLFSLSIIMSVVLVQNFMAPLRELNKVTNKLAEGDFSIRVGSIVTGRRDEIANLGKSFNWMAERVENLITSQQRLLSDISHEIRSPLQRMDVALTLARKNPCEDVEQYFDRVEIEIERINDMVEELLTLTREASDVTFERSFVNITETLHSIIDDAEFEGQAEEKTIRSDIQEDLFILADTNLIRRALGNVIYNAVRYTVPQSSIQVKATLEEGQHVVIEVEDSGPGVSEDELEKIFRPYYRTDSARERTQGGTGLGLAITKRIVEGYKGTIVATNSPTGGLKVTVRFNFQSP